jgi:hypothetical protein
MIRAIIVSLFFVTPSLALTDISSCDNPPLKSSNETYRLTADLDCASNGGEGNAAIHIEASNVTFDFNGHWLKFANDRSGLGVRINGGVAMPDSTMKQSYGKVVFRHGLLRRPKVSYSL